METTYQEMSLSFIGLNPKNPRKDVEKSQAFKDLVESIKGKGILEPILVRPAKADGLNPLIEYEIVAGERRFRAARALGMETVPVIIREMSDDEAFEAMFIENLIRQDLTEKEEAEGFKRYLGKKGPEAIGELALKTGLNPRYIRSRVDVLSLPDYILKAWEAGKVGYSHLVQFLRIRDDAKFLKEMFNKAAAQASFRGWDRQPAEQIKEDIDRKSPPLGKAMFKVDEAGCGTCSKNSAVQKDLWGDVAELKGAHCLDPACFKKKTIEYLKENWQETEWHEKFKTLGFRFSEDLDYGDWRSFYRGMTQPTKKCFECQFFVSVFHYDGRVEAERACIGDKSCYKAVEKEQRKAEKVVKGEKKERGDGPRVPWHGEYFRDVFFFKRLPEVLKAADPESKEILTMLMVCALKGNGQARMAVGEALKIKDAQWSDSAHKLIKTILEKPYAEVKALFTKAVEMIVLEGDHKGEWSGFGTTDRFNVAKFLGIDLANEWAPTEEYLQKKTIKELINFGMKSKLFKDKKVLTYLKTKVKKESFEKCKKTELVDCFLKSGVGLIGKVPAEILSE